MRQISKRTIFFWGAIFLLLSAVALVFRFYELKEEKIQEEIQTLESQHR
tara:strand:+ start:22490 stop:22636 length:147 start_codon:yes stop_codon:yes gene_type:complete